MSRKLLALGALTGAHGQHSFLRGLIGLAGVEPDCFAYSEEDCLGKPGCRWFSYDSAVGCPLCDDWFGPAGQEVTGCRSWQAEDWCKRMVFEEARSRYVGSPDDDDFRDAIQRYQVSQGTGEPGNFHQKRAICSVWCEFDETNTCTAKPRAKNEVKGVNYGGRLIPEYYLQMPGSDDLFWGIRPPSDIPNATLSLCDVAKARDARQRLTKFLDLNIQEKHFAVMASQGFNTVRLPVGYWELIGLPGSSAPNSMNGERWRALQYIMEPSAYMTWIDSIFVFAQQHGLKVLMDLHGAPGGQSDEAFTGCDQGRGMFFFDTPWNRQIAVQAVEQMAAICKKYGDTCYGIELLNEPQGPADPGEAAPAISRSHLRDFYLDAISAARKHLDRDKPILIMDWPSWLSWWKEQEPFNFADHGRIIFSTHVYHLAEDAIAEEQTRTEVTNDLQMMSEFYWQSKYELLVTEYALSGHGTGSAQSDFFDYSRLGNWMVFQFSTIGLGSMVWNFDAAPWLPAWGPVAAERLGKDSVDWRRIFTGTPRTRSLRVNLV